MGKCPLIWFVSLLTVMCFWLSTGYLSLARKCHYIYTLLSLVYFALHLYCRVPVSFFTTRCRAKIFYTARCSRLIFFIFQIQGLYVILPFMSEGTLRWRQCWWNLQRWIALSHHSTVIQSPLSPGVKLLVGMPAWKCLEHTIWKSIRKEA